MNHYKYACPYCGQHIEYTDGYVGQQMPCPMCRHPIVFPAVAPGKLTSSLRLAGPIAKPKESFQFSFAGIVLFLREFHHWKIVGMCLAPFGLVAAALVATSVIHSSPPPPPPPPTDVAVDPHALHKLTDLTRADQEVQEQVQVANRASAALQSAEQNHASAGSIKQAQAAITTARKRFESTFAKYQKLGGVVNYRLQLQ